MAYVKTHWNNNTAPSINAKNLNKMEDGIANGQESAELANKRIDNLAQLPAGSTTGDAELIDIRIKADGTTEKTAGAAVRAQFNELKNNMGGLKFYLTEDGLLHIEGGWAAGEAYNVIYVIDNGVSYGEKVYNGETILMPKTFNPDKLGWYFLGWKLDKTADGSVLQEKNMEGEDVTLYAVFYQDITLQCRVPVDASGGPYEERNGKRYYNNLNVNNPLFTVAQKDQTGWIKRGWSAQNAVDGAIAYNEIKDTPFSQNAALYAMYQASIGVTYNGNGADSGSVAAQEGTRYFNSVTIKNPTFTIQKNGFSKYCHNFVGWNTNKNSGASEYAPGSTQEFGASKVLYAIWSAFTYYVRYNGNGSTGGSMSDTVCRYGQTYNLKDNAFSKTNYSFQGWATSADGIVAYSNKAPIKNLSTVDGSTVNLYAVWRGNPWYFTPSSVTWSFQKDSHADGDYEVGDHVKLWTQNRGTVSYANAYLFANIPTRKCNKVRLTVIASTGGAGGSCTINGKDATETMTFDVSGEYWGISLQVQDPDEYGRVSIEIAEIYFYNE